MYIGAGTYPRHDKVFEAGDNAHVRRSKNGIKELYRADWGLRQWAPFLVGIDRPLIHYKVII